MKITKLLSAALTFLTLLIDSKTIFAGEHEIKFVPRVYKTTRLKAKYNRNIKCMNKTLQEIHHHSILKDSTIDVIFNVSKETNKVSSFPNENNIIINVPEIYSKWCSNKHQIQMANKINKAIEEAVNKLIAKTVSTISSKEDLFTLIQEAQCQATELFKTLSPDFYTLNEQSGVVENHKGQKVEDIKTLQWISPIFFEKRVNRDFSFIKKGTQSEKVIDDPTICEVIDNMCDCKLMEYEMVPKYEVDVATKTLKLKFNSGVAYSAKVISHDRGPVEMCGTSSIVETDDSEEHNSEVRATLEIEVSQEANVTPPQVDPADKKGKGVQPSSEKEGPKVFIIGERPSRKIPIFISGTKTRGEKERLKSLTGSKQRAVEKAKSQDLLARQWERELEELLSLDSPEDASENISFSTNEEVEIQEIDLGHLLDEDNNIYTKDTIHYPGGSILSLSDNHFVCIQFNVHRINPFIIKLKQETVDQISTMEKPIDSTVFKVGQLTCLLK